MESLEARRLLALQATVNSGVLVVSQDATPEDDALTVEYDAGIFGGNGGLRLTAATLNGGTPLLVDAATFDSISIDTGGETADTVDVPASSDPFTGAAALGSFTITTGQIDIDAGIEVGSELSLTLNSSAQSNISSSISGAGGFAMDAQGTVRLLALHSYTGPTTVTAGTLELFEVNQLPSGTAATINGVLVVSPFQTIGSLAGTGSVLLADPLTVGGNGQSTTFAGVLSGAGRVVKTGAGTLTLSGDNTYTGTTAVNGGTLHVTGRIGGGGAMAAGMVTIASGATLSGGGDAASGQGIVNAAIDGTAGSTILATDDFVIGSDTANILRTFGTLDVNGHTVSLKFSGIAFVTGSGAAVDLGGGTIIAGGDGLHVGSGGTLTGAGTVAGLVTIQNDATLDPGSSASVMALSQLLMQQGTSISDPGSRLNIRVDGGDGPGQSGGHSQVVVDAALDGAARGDGTVDLDNFGTLGGVLELTLADLSSSIVGGESLVILDNDGNDLVAGFFKRLVINGIDQGTFEVAEGDVVSMDFGGSGLTATITYQGGDGNDVAINVIAPSANLPASGGSYELVHESATGDVVVREVGTANEFFRMPAGSFPSLQINGAANASDSLTVQLSPTNPIPGGGVSFHGGVGGNDGLAVVGGGTDTAIYTPDAGTTGNGSIDVNGTGTITFTGLEPVDISGMLNATLSLPPTGRNDTITLENGSDFFSGGTNDALLVSGTTGDPIKGDGNGIPIETVAFYNNASVTIDTTQLDGDDLITINSASNNHGNATLIINAGLGDDDMLVNGNVSLAGNLNVASNQVSQFAGTIDVQSLFVSGNVTLAGTALVTSDSATSSVSGGVTIGDSDGTDDAVTLQGNLSVVSLMIRHGDTFDLQASTFNAFGPTLIEDNATLDIASSGPQISWNNISIPGSGTFRMDGFDGTLTFAPGATFAIGDGDGQSATVNIHGATSSGIVLQAFGSSASDPPDWLIIDNPGDANHVSFSNVDVLDSDARGGKTIRAQDASTLTRALNWQPPNSPPQAVAGGPYDVFERDDLLLDAGGSADPDACCGDSIVEYAWDLDNDGDFTDHVATTPQTVVSWATLDSLSLPLDAPLAIQLRVTDQAGGLTSIGPTTLTIFTSEPQPVITVMPPGAVGCDVLLTFDGTASTHTNPGRTIAFYEWDFDFDGTFETDATGPNVTHTYLQFGTHQTALRVTDDDAIEPQVRIATTITAVEFTNVAPIAFAGGPYTSTIMSGVPQPIMLDASGSDENVPCDDIVSFEWDFDGDGQYGADDVDGVHGNASLAEPVGATIAFVDPTWNAGEVHTIALRVTDGFGAESFDSTTVDIVLPPLPPNADAGGPYVIGTGQGVTLDGSGSSDPNECCGDSIVEYAWDFDGDGVYGETETGQTEPLGSTATVMVDADALDAFGLNQQDTPYTIRLRVTDNGGLTGEATTTLTIRDNEPVAAFTADPNPAACNQTIALDASGSFHTFPGRSIVSYEWDFDDDGQFDDAAGPMVQHAFDTFGNFPVSLLVTDDNTPPRTDVAELVVHVNQGNNPPQVDAGGPYVLELGSDLTLDGGGSSDASVACGDRVATYQWDIDNDGSHDFSTSAQTVLVPWLDLEPRVQYPADPNTGLPSNTIRLTVSDTLGATSSATTTLVIYDNRPFPVIAVTPDPPVVDLGEPVTFDASGSFHGHPDFEIADWAWDFDAADGLGFEGTPPDPDATGPTATHTFNSFGTFTVTLQVFDNNTPPRSDTATVTVFVNSPLDVNAGEDQSAAEGEVVNLARATFHDSGAGDTHTATIDWGDGTPIELGAVSEGPSGSMSGVDGTVAGSHVYADDGTYTVVVCVSDDEETSCDAQTATIENAPPVVDAGPDRTIDEGESIVLDPATFSDHGTADTHTATIDWGDGSANEASAVNESPFGPPGSAAGANGVVVFPSHQYAESGSYTVEVCVADDDLAVACDMLMIDVGNAPPVVEAGPDRTAREGQPVSFAGSFTDPTSGESHQIEWDFGDGSKLVTGTLAPAHVYADDGVYVATLTVADASGNSASDTLEVLVSNVSPSLGTLELTPSIFRRLDTSTLSGTYSDPGSADLHVVDIDWDGDGVYDDISVPIGSGSFALGHAFDQAPGEYAALVRLRDSDGDATSGSVRYEVTDLEVFVQDVRLFHNNSAFDRGRDELITIGGAGTSGHVKVFDGATGGEQAGFLAFPGFSGGVTVAAGDIDGDGRADIVTGTGPGAPVGHVKVVSGADGSLLRSFFAFTGFSGGVSVAAGDLNGDGRDDIITGAGAGAPGGHVKIFSGADGSLLSSFFAFEGFSGGVNVAAGDVSGDGRPDVIVGAAAGAPGGHVKVFSGADGSLLSSFFAFGGFTGGVNVAAGDIDGDGQSDIITGAGAGGGPHVKVFDGRTGEEVRSFFAFDPAFLGGVRVAAGDVSGDGVVDVIASAGAGAGPHVKVFDGRTHAELSSFFAYDTAFLGGVFVASGDVDGDGAGSADDERAINLDVDPLRPGQTATTRNVTSSSRGINGLAVDFVNPPNRGVGITAADLMFLVSTDGETWNEGPTPTSVVGLAGARPGGAHRVLVTFEDGAIVDKWLCITVKANASTGLAQEQVYYFASVVGETGAAFAGLGEYFGRDAADFRAIVAAGLNRPADAGDRHDVNDNGRADIFDIQSIAIAGIRPNVLPVITPPADPMGAGSASVAFAPPLLLPVGESAATEPIRRVAKDAVFGLLRGPTSSGSGGGPLFRAATSSRHWTEPDDEVVSDLLKQAAFRPTLRDQILESFARIA